MRRALFVCSSRIHGAMYRALRQPAARNGVAVDVLADRRLGGVLASGGAAVDAQELSLNGLRRLSVVARRARARALLSNDHDLLIVGNDAAPLERAMIQAARERALATVLLQDGLFPAWSVSKYRLLVARTMNRVGLSELAPTEYAAGTATHVGTLGLAWVPSVRARSAVHARVEVAGNVALAETVLRARSRSSDLWKRELNIDGRLATFFTSDVLRGLGGTRWPPHRLQIAELGATAEAMTALGWRLAVRLHPNEHPEDYPAAIRRLILPIDAPLEAVLGATDLGLVTMSSVALLLADLGRSVCRPAARGVPRSDLAACTWLGIPIVGDLRDVIADGIGIRADRLREIVLDPDAAAGATLDLLLSALDGVTVEAGGTGSRLQ